MDEKKILTAIILFVAIFISLIAYQIFTISSGHTQSKFESAIAAQNPADKCSAPEGYTDAQWKAHMSHHPEMYKECLNNPQNN